MRNRKNWGQWFSWAEYWYNSSHHSSLGTTPFKPLYGRDPPKILRYNDTPIANAAVDEMIQDRDSLLEEIKGNLLKAQGRMQDSANKNRWDIEFQVGDMAYLKMRSYRQASVA